MIFFHEKAPPSTFKVADGAILFGCRVRGHRCPLTHSGWRSDTFPYFSHSHCGNGKEDRTIVVRPRLGTISINQSQ